MSEMLEQAIIDAAALKEAAIKNAETLVLEKYSSEIKSAVENLLEQEDPMADLGGMDAAADTDIATPNQDAPVSSIIDQIPMASIAEDGMIELPLDKLMEELNIQLDEDEDLEEAVELEESEELQEEVEELEEEQDLDEVAKVALDEEFLASIAEHLTVDIKPQKRGWAGISEGEIEIAEEELLAMEQDSKVREERAAIRKAVKALEGVNETLMRKNNTLKESLSSKDKEAQKLRRISILMKEELENLSLTNTKLVLQNKALTSDSLNERQKQKLAEAISNAETAEEAKVIFETLQNTVGSTSHKKQPESLSEAVQKSSSIIMSSRRENSERQKANPTLNRWKFLAGIQKD